MLLNVFFLLCSDIEGWMEMFSFFEVFIQTTRLVVFCCCCCFFLFSKKFVSSIAINKFFIPHSRAKKHPPNVVPIPKMRVVSTFLLQVYLICKRLNCKIFQEFTLFRRVGTTCTIIIYHIVLFPLVHTSLFSLCLPYGFFFFLSSIV